ncbi:MAG: SusC/RagA family TonB-linked outer membrane protein, partial [Parabacteroides sp.]|nr:SusC/RagA family TonB-linked outer membrane protein [Parabacteroides sp.]
MVNKRFSNSWSIKYRIMKIAALFLILGINASLASSTYSQSATLSLKANNKTVQEIFSEIEKQSEYVFFYYDGILDVNRKVKLDITDQTVDIILNQLFTGTDNTYVIKDRQIFISKKKNTGLIGPLPLKAQDRSSFRGKVLDDLGEPLPGAAILVAGSTRGVTTDLDGSFELEVNKSDKLVISYLGMEDQEIVIGNQNDVVIRMKPKADELEEVTVVAYGKQKKASVIGAISTITSEQLQVPVAKLSTSLAGQMAGIVAIQRTGEPGAGADFWIRGISSFGANNTPLILVDGIERSMDLVDPEDIATFSILKDATATALYGVRGANGIVLITTKRGREAKPAINARVEYGISNPTVTPKMANASQWMDYYNDITLQGNGQLAYQPGEYDKHVNHTDPDLYPNVDWWDTTFRNISNNIRANVNVSGGGKSVRYYVAGSFYSENGIFKPVKNPQYDPQVGYKKINFRANVDINVTRLTELSLSLSNQYEIKNRLGVAMESVYNNTLAVSSVAVVPVFSDGRVDEVGTGSLVSD